MPRTKTRHSEKYNSAFPANLRLLMDKTNTTQKALGEAIDKSRQQVSFYCDGTSSPDWEGVRKIAAYFGVSTDYLLGCTKIESPDANIQTIANSTCLTEKNIEFLIATRSNALFSDCINDMIQVAQDVALNHWQMKSTLTIPAPSNFQGKNLEEEFFQFYKSTCEANSRGYVQLSGEEAFLYFCDRIADTVKDSLKQKYTQSAAWREKNGNDSKAR